MCIKIVEHFCRPIMANQLTMLARKLKSYKLILHDSDKMKLFIHIPLICRHMLVVPSIKNGSIVAIVSRHRIECKDRWILTFRNAPVNLAPYTPFPFPFPFPLWSPRRANKLGIHLLLSFSLSDCVSCCGYDTQTLGRWVFIARAPSLFWKVFLFLLAKHIQKLNSAANNW